jgi:hypothetical protein
VTLTKLELQGWRQRGYEFGRYRRGMDERAAIAHGAEAVAAFQQGRRAGERELDAVHAEKSREFALKGARA